LRIFALVLLVVLAGCAHPPQISTSLDFEKKPDLIIVKVRVANLENRPTTPIAVEVTAQPHVDGRWQRPITVLNPAAFVLNRREQRDLMKYWRIDADAVRTTLVLKEQETGHILKSERAEKRW